MGKKSEIAWGEQLQRAKNDPAVQKWWDEEQVQLDLDLVQGEDDLGIQWDELSDESKRELIMKIGYGSKQANGILSVLAGRPSISWLEWNDDHSVKKELRKLGVTDPPGTILHKGRRFWKDLDQWEKMDVAGKYLTMKNDKILAAQKMELEKAKKKLETLKKLNNPEKSVVGLVAGLFGLGLAGLAKRKAK